MKVTISVFSRFHAFYLADQLERRGHLERLITSYPRFEVKKYGIPPAKVTSLLAHEILARGWNQLPDRLKSRFNPEFVFHELFDRDASRHIPTDTDLFVGWSGFSERGIRRAREAGAVTVVERGSAHIEVQRDLLAEEYQRYGLRPELPHPKIVEKEVREYELADYISVPSTFALQTFLDQGFDATRLIHAPLGVDLQNFTPLEKDDDVFRVVFAGALSLRKGVHYLLQAFAELQLPQAELWLIGSIRPEVVPFLERFQRTFRHIAHIPQGQLREYYARCSVFALCSIEDGMGMVLSQAMACGLPIICTTNTGGKDLIEDGKQGFVVPIRDVAALKDRILYLYQHPEERVEMGRMAQHRVRSCFTWDDYGRRISLRYKEMIDLAAGEK
jgi:glycosyltransferase involved in cell wall biosynthesis